MVIRAFNKILTHSRLFEVQRIYGLLLCRKRSVRLLNCAVPMFAALVTQCWSHVSNTCSTIFLCKGNEYCPHGLSLVSCI